MLGWYNLSVLMHFVSINYMAIIFWQMNLFPTIYLYLYMSWINLVESAGYLVIRTINSVVVDSKIYE